MRGRVTGITYSGGATNSFTYNGLDTRVSKVDSGGTKTYRRDGTYVTDSVLSDGSATYTPGVSERRSGNSKFAHLDYLGSLKEETNSGQGTSTTRSYDAFGNVLSTTGTVRTPFGFAGGWGYQEDVDSGLKLLGHRYYDSSTGRFLTRDPAYDGRNWYAYCENSPSGSSDPEGRAVIVLAYFAAGFVAGVLAGWGVYLHEESNKDKHVRLRKEALDRLQRELDRLNRTKGPKKRKPIEDLIRKIRDGLLGHEKKMDQRWPGWRGGN